MRAAFGTHKIQFWLTGFSDRYSLLEDLHGLGTHPQLLAERVDAILCEEMRDECGSYTASNGPAGLCELQKGRLGKFLRLQNSVAAFACCLNCEGGHGTVCYCGFRIAAVPRIRGQ